MGCVRKGCQMASMIWAASEVTVRDGKCLLTSSGSLAGSIVTMNSARLNLAKWLELSIHEQLQITSTNQANRLGLSSTKRIYKYW